MLQVASNDRFHTGSRHDVCGLEWSCELRTAELADSWAGGADLGRWLSSTVLRSFSCNPAKSSTKKQRCMSSTNSVKSVCISSQVSSLRLQVKLSSCTLPYICSANSQEALQGRKLFLVWKFLTRNSASGPLGNASTSMKCWSRMQQGSIRWRYQQISICRNIASSDNCYLFLTKTRRPSAFRIAVWQCRHGELQAVT